MTNISEYIISMVADTRGIKKAETELTGFNMALKRVGVSVDSVSRIIDTRMTTSVNKKGKVVKRSTVIWEDFNKKVNKTSFTLSKAGKAVSRVSNTMGVASKTTAGFAGNMMKLGLRAAMTIPTWLLLRGIMMGFVTTIRDMVQGFIKLDDAMARIKTVTHGTAEEVSRDMSAIRHQILAMAQDTRAPLEQLTEAFYFLKTSNLETAEAMAGFAPTINAMVGTMNNAQSTARAVAGMYNTMGHRLGENLTITQKFTKIADVLTYTYATQDVQLSELVASYEKMAPYITGLTDKFEDMVTMLGFLSTHLLRSGRAGRLTGRAILQILKNVEKLSGALGVTFDPDQPLNFLDTIEQVRDRMGALGQLTARQSQIIQEIFATRAGVSVRLLIEHFDDLKETIKKAGIESEGFAKKMAEIKMDTIAGQSARLKNNMVVLFETFITGAVGVDTFKDALKGINEYIISFTAGLGALNAYITTVAHNLGEFKKLFPGGETKKKSFVDEMIDLLKDPLKLKSAFKFPKMQADVDFKSPMEAAMEFGEEYGGIVDRIAESMKEQLGVERDRLELEKLRTDNLKKEKEDIDFIAKKMALMGSNEEEIVKFRLQRLQVLVEEGYILEDSLDILKAQHAVELAMIKRVQEFGNEFKKSVQGGFAEFIKGEKTISEMFDDISEKMMNMQIEAFSKAAIDKLFDFTGLGEVFGGYLKDIEDMFKSEGEKVADYHGDVLKRDGKAMADYHGSVIRAAMGGKSTQDRMSKVMAGADRAGGIMDFFGTSGKLADKRFFARTKQQTKDFIEAQRKLGKTPTAAEAKGGFTGGQAIGAAMGAYQLSQLYKLKGTGNVMGGGIQGAMAGASIGSLAGPIGTAIGAVLGGAYGMIRGGQSKTTEEVSRQTFQIASRIDITNKSLGIVNRNLIDQTSVFETYILRESEYFSEKRNLDDEFALHGMRGLN